MLIRVVAFFPVLKNIFISFEKLINIVKPFSEEFEVIEIERSSPPTSFDVFMHTSEFLVYAKKEGNSKVSLSDVGEISESLSTYDESFDVIDADRRDFLTLDVCIPCLYG